MVYGGLDVYIHFNSFFETLGTRLVGLADNSGVVEVSPYVNDNIIIIITNCRNIC